jgi:hypothetical protein
MFLVESGKGPVVAFIAAISMVTFSATAYTAARHVAQDKGIGALSRLFFSTFLVVCGTGTILFSVFSTVNVSYEQFKAKKTEVAQAAVAADTSVNTSSVLLASKEKQLVDKDAEIAGYQNDVNRFYPAMTAELPVSDIPDDPVVKAAATAKALATRNYNRAVAALAAARADKKALYDAQEKLLNDKDAKTVKVENSQESAYTMVAAKLGVSEPDVRLVVYVIPAVFFDVIAPFAIAIVLLLKDRLNGAVKIGFMDRMLEAMVAKARKGGQNGSIDR